MKKNHGYTLLEILVALAVFAILSTLTASAMYQAFDTRTRVNAQANQLNALQLGLTLIARDTEQVVGQATSENATSSTLPFVGQSNYLEFTRGGLVNPNGIEARSTLKRIAYTCVGHKLIRRSWERIDTPARNHYQDKTILEHLDECKFAYMTQNHRTQSEWQVVADQQNEKVELLPIAIRFTLTPHGWGNMILLFTLPEALYV